MQGILTGAGRSTPLAQGRQAAVSRSAFDRAGALAADASCLFIIMFFYARAIAPDWRGLNTLFLAVGLGFLVVHVTQRLLSRKIAKGFDTLSMASLGFVFVGVSGGMLSTFLNPDFEPTSAPDLGTLAFICLAPFILLFADRTRIIAALGVLSVAFAIADAVVNLLAFFEIYELAQYSNRVDEFGSRLRYTGLTGNTHASGLVMFIATMILVWGFRVQRIGLITVLSIGLLLAISGYLIDARRYVAFSLIGVLLVFWPQRLRIPALAISLSLAAIFLYSTFTADLLDYGNQLRASLMVAGWRDALHNPVLGQGLFYRDQSELIPTFYSLSQAGVVESMLIEFMRDFGIFFALLWFIGVILALCKPNVLDSLPGIIFTLLVSELFFGGVLRGPAGSILFYSCYCFLICDLVSAKMNAVAVPAGAASAG